MTARFDSPGVILTGGGCRRQAAELLSSLRARKTLLVADPFFAASEFRSVLSKLASDALDSGSPQNNPIVPSLGQIVELYEAAW